MAKYLCIWVRAYWFSVTSFSKWLPGGHIRFFGFLMAWFWQRNSSLLWNFSFKFHVHVLCGCRQKPNDCQLCRFQNGCLVIRASKTFVLFVLCTEAKTGYFGGRQAVKGEDSQYSLTEALSLFWVSPWGLHLSPVANIHIIDRVLYCRMAFLSPTHNWKLTLKMIQGIRKILFNLI